MSFMMKLLLIFTSSIILLTASQITFAQESSLQEKNIYELESTLVSLLQEKRFEESLFYLDKILEIDPNHMAALLNRGSVLIELDRSGEAIAYYDRLLAIDPDNISGLTSKAAALTNIGKNLDALELYNKVLSIDKDNEKIQEFKARLLSITPTVSSNHLENSDVKYDIHLRVTVRTTSGELVAVIEDSHGRYLPGSFTDYIFDQFFEKETVEVNGQKFQIGKNEEVYQSNNDFVGNYWYSAEMNDYSISVFEVYPPHVGVESGDQLHVEWTISKKLS